MNTKNLVVELLVEELPPKVLKSLGEVFAHSIASSLEKSYLIDRAEVIDVQAFASPRRLSALIPQVKTVAPDRPLSHKLMPVSVGLTEMGQATPALFKKLASLGADESALTQLRQENNVLFFDTVIKGLTLTAGLQIALDEMVSKLPIPKVMSYQLENGWTTVHFVRPVHRLVALHGNEIVPVQILGLQAGRVTQGHRFEAMMPTLLIQEADSYLEQLKTEGAVIANFVERRNEIQQQLTKAAQQAGKDLQPVMDEDLLDEVTALVERPNVLIGRFEEKFLEVPQECLILTMQANQKYFPLLDKQGRLTHQFLIVSNITPSDPSAVIHGNERVIRPRLADAKFFFDQDRKKTLASRLSGLDKVVYHSKLGTQGERIQRVLAIAKLIGTQLGGSELATFAGQAAQLAKADLLTDMVGEFPQLQGIMGRYYALHDGLSLDIADAIEDHYKPRFAGDQLPRNRIGICLALADKLETLIGLFGIGQQPSGDKDPFALRRHALGIIRIIVENDLDLDLYQLITTIQDEVFDKLISKNPVEIIEFIAERFSGLLREQGYTPQEIAAVLSKNKMHLALVNKQLLAVRAFIGLPESSSLAAANKRVGNILKKTELIQTAVDHTLLKEPAEQALYESLQAISPEAEQAYVKGDYTASLKTLAGLKTPVDTFFDQVMVNTEDTALRNNRIALLNQLKGTMNRVADLSYLAN